MKKILVQYLQSLKLLVLLASLLFVSHCGDNKKVDPTFTSIQQNVLGGGSSSCGQSACHQTGTLAYSYIKLDMNTNKAGQYTAIQSTTAQNIQNPECDTIPVVKPGNWDGSLMKAMAGSDSDRAEFKAANGNCTPKRFSDMFGSLDAATIEAIKTWVNAGALDN